MFLGLSIFNLGSAFGQKETSVPKSAGNFRRKEDVNVNPELKGMMQTVEEEAKLVLSQQGKVFANQEQENLNMSQTFLRYGVVSVWVVSAGVIFTSLLFNLPFALGRAVLSALPGTAHTAVLKLTPSKESYLPGEKINLELTLSSDEEVSSARVFLQYPQGVFFFDKVDSQFVSQTIFQPEGIEIVFSDLKNQKFSSKDALAKVSFGTEASLKKELADSAKIDLVWDKSLILNVEKEPKNKKNILGKVINNQFFLSSR